jgi:hypothetical protein
MGERDLTLCAGSVAHEISDAMETPSARRGRPRIHLDLDKELLRGLGRVGLDLEGVAEVLGASRRTLRTRLEQCPEIHLAYREGSAEFRALTVAAAKARIAVLRAARVAAS